jgi:S-adenosylmethionine-dependent methyltransferase
VVALIDGRGVDARGSTARPLDEADVCRWLSESGISVTSKAGIRVIHDLVPTAMRQAEQLDGLIAAELALSRMEPFASLAQHVHLVG